MRDSAGTDDDDVDDKCHPKGCLHCYATQLISFTVSVLTKQRGARDLSTEFSSDKVNGQTYGYSKKEELRFESEYVVESYWKRKRTKLLS